MEKAKTFYGIIYWLQDTSDFGDLNGYPTLKQALAKAKALRDNGEGYHSFTIYAYHAELITDDFIEDGRIYHRQKWQRLDDGYENLRDINGEPI